MNRTTTIDLSGQGLGRFAFTLDGALAYTTRDGSFVTFDPADGTETSLFLGVTFGGFDFTADGDVLALLVDDEPGTTVLRFAPGGTQVDRIAVTRPATDDPFADDNAAVDLVLDGEGRVIVAPGGSERLWTVDLETGQATYAYDALDDFPTTGGLLSVSETGQHVVSLNGQSTGADVTVLDTVTGTAVTTNSFDAPITGFNRYEAATSSRRDTVLLSQSDDLLLFDTDLALEDNVSALDDISRYGGVAVSDDGRRFYVVNEVAEAIMVLDARDLSLQDSFAVDLFENEDDRFFGLEDGSLAVADGGRLFAVGTNEAIEIVDRDFAAAPDRTRTEEVFGEDGSAEVEVARALQLGTFRDEALSGDDETGSGFQLWGGNGDDTLTGASENDVLVGGADDDRLAGLGGTDTLRGGRGDDAFVFGEGGGRDDVLDFEQGADVIDLSAAEGATGLDQLQIVRVGGDLTISITSRDSVRLLDFDGEVTAADFVFFTGPSAGADVLSGTDGNDVIDGLGGDDTIEGGLGADLITGGAGDDLLYGDFALAG